MEVLIEMKETRRRGLEVILQQGEGLHEDGVLTRTYQMPSALAKRSHHEITLHKERSKCAALRRHCC